MSYLVAVYIPLPSFLRLSEGAEGYACTQLGVGREHFNHHWRLRPVQSVRRSIS